MRSFQELHQKYSIGKLIKKLDDRYGFQALIRSLTGHWFNPFATLYINFFSFPFQQAIKFPIFVYGAPGLYHVVGDMRIIGNVKTGMIEFNKNQHLNPPHQLANSELSNLGTIIFHGKARIGCATRILVQKNALLELGANILIGDNVNLGCHQYISIGERARISHRCQVQESNHHFIANMSTRTVKPCTRPISIGRGCWICNSTTLTAGATIPDFALLHQIVLLMEEKIQQMLLLVLSLEEYPPKSFHQMRIIAYLILNGKVDYFNGLHRTKMANIYCHKTYLLKN